HYKEYEQWQKAGGEATGVPFDVYMRGGVGTGAGAGTAPGGGTYQYRNVSPEDLQDMFGDDSAFSDFFYSMFGDNAGRAGAGFRSQAASGPRKGRDQEALVEISLEEAFNGAKRMLSLSGGPGQPSRRLE